MKFKKVLIKEVRPACAAVEVASIALSAAAPFTSALGWVCGCG